ncbi:MAG: hypothetical protein WAU86_16785 [Oricola sp.]
MKALKPLASFGLPVGGTTWKPAFVNLNELPDPEEMKFAQFG